MDNRVSREAILSFCEKTYGTKPDFPWENDTDNAVLRHSHSGKWYALLMRVKGKRLGLDTDQVKDVLNLKCDKAMLGSMLTKQGCLPAYHMSKSSWVSVLLDGSMPLEEVLVLLDMSYELTGKKNRGKM